MPQIEYIYVECSYLALYEGQALISDVRSYLVSKHYELRAEINIVKRPGIGSVQSDCLFTAKHE